MLGNKFYVIPIKSKMLGNQIKKVNSSIAKVDSTIAGTKQIQLNFKAIGTLNSR